jgi:hypothetical protein
MTPPMKHKVAILGSYSSPGVNRPNSGASAASMHINIKKIPIATQLSSILGTFELLPCL